MADLILDSLEIRNFRAFHHLRIEKLGRVNLITGKNNVGKTCLLEALWLYSHRGFPLFIWEILGGRNESPRPSSKRFRTSFAGGPESTVKYLFHGRKEMREKLEPILIGPIAPKNRKLSVSIGWYVEDEDEEGDTVFKLITLDQLATAENPVPRFRVKVENQLTSSYPLDRNPSLLVNKSRHKDIHCVYASTNGLTTEDIGSYWDKIALSDSEGDVIAGLRIIAPNVVGVSLISSPELTGERVAIVRLDGVHEPLPLRSLGEGMNRMLGLVLALVNAKDGILLIDEADIGIHYSALPDVWSLIFQIAHRLNVQVFATTHSWDCIQSFQQAADENTEEEGLLIRLENRDGEVSAGGEVSATLFDERKLTIATREHIEVR